jgi:hypothetical protein
MGKRSDKFERAPRDFYPTPASAVQPLLQHLPDVVQFDEPCAGDGALVRHLEEVGHSLTSASDIQPMAQGISKRDALSISQCHSDMFITNPPWPEPNRRGDPTLAILVHLSTLAPLWVLLPADFAHNRYFAEVGSRCQKIVSVGRVKWIAGTKHSGKDNAAWYLFDGTHSGATTFHGRAANSTKTGQRGHHDNRGAHGGLPLKRSKTR